ncbi:CGNR zinc finger domain-containing protein [Streptomyces odontomachi]|uniref:CGNR zinc finger domain-containing protein n=1 Tax=Streptomyces odontomachi TaxID=2944940 RepID=UPI00210A1307|nr:CGNR zinc finger domain-containing protein [Streptomyces sp. ODS25]
MIATGPGDRFVNGLQNPVGIGQKAFARNAPDPLPVTETRSILIKHGIVRNNLTEQQTAMLQAWRRRLAPCFGPQPLDERCRTVNRLLADTASRPHVSLHDGHAPHLHYSAPDADPVTHICAVTVAGLAYVICFASAERLGRCARGACQRVFVDTSRNGRRSYCSVRCANNEAVARHRREKAELAAVAR